jgi:hypothetical protein
MESNLPFTPKGIFLNKEKAREKLLFPYKAEVPAGSGGILLAYTSMHGPGCQLGSPCLLESTENSSIPSLQLGAVDTLPKILLFL